MAEGTRYKELEKMVVGLRQSQDQQGKSLEDHQGALESLNLKLDMLLEAVNANGSRLGHQNSGGRPDGANPEQRGMQFRAIKIDFLKFDGDNPIGWVYKANHYFALYPMPDGQKIWMASLYMEGIALIWFQGAEETGLFVSWNAFVDALQLRFGNSSYDDPMEALKRLKQTSTVTVYKTQFEEISNRLTRLSEDYKLSLFLSGLRDEIRLPVRMLHPQSLNSAFGLAKMQEEYIHSIRGNFRGGNYQNSFAPFSVGGNGFTNNFTRKENTLVEKNNSFKPSLPIEEIKGCVISVMRNGTLVINVRGKRLGSLSWKGWSYFEMMTSKIVRWKEIRMWIRF